MKKKNGFIAISLIYSFFLCFIIIMMGLLANYTHSKLILNKINKPLEYNVNYPLLSQEIMKNKTSKTENCNINFLQGEPLQGESTECGSGLFASVDEENKTTYYFRGSITNNYVLFANQLWRIIRINGDGSIRIITEDDVGESIYNNDMASSKFVGYTYDNDHICNSANPCNTNSGNNTDIKSFLENWYSNNLNQFDAQIAEAYYCNDTTNHQRIINGEIIENVYDFGFEKRHGYTTNLAMPTFSCPNTTETYGGLYKLKIGLITADEVTLAGIIYGGTSSATLENYLVNDNKSQFWTLTPGSTNIGSTNNIYGCKNGVSSYYVMGNHLGSRSIDNTGCSNTGSIEQELLKIRPVINLNKNTKVTGSGTQKDPYVVK